MRIYIKIITLAILIIFCGLYSSNSFGQDLDYSKMKFNAPIIVGKYEFKIINGKINGEGRLTNIIGYDSNYKMVEYYEEDGLSSSYRYDSIGNEIEHIFYENYDSNGIRTISSKSQSIYENGLEVRTNWFEFINGAWVNEQFSHYKYKFNKRGQIIEQQYLLGEDYVSWVSYYEYDDNFNSDKKYYYNQENKLITPGCYKKITIDEFPTKTTKISYYQHLSESVIEHQTSSLKNYEFKFQNHYSNQYQIVEEHQYSDQDYPYWVRKYYFDSKGLLMKMKWYDSDWEVKNKLINYYEYRIIVQ